MDTSDSNSLSRKPGGQPGNNNALKHGFYSFRFTRAENERLDSGMIGELEDEEALINILIDRTFESIKEAEMTHADWVVAMRAICQAIGRKESIHRSRKAIYEKETTLEKAMDELKYIPLEED